MKILQAATLLVIIESNYCKPDAMKGNVHNIIYDYWYYKKEGNLT